MVAKRWVPEVSGGGEHQWSTFNVWRHHWIVALLSALANTPPSPAHQHPKAFQLAPSACTWQVGRNMRVKPISPQRARLKYQRSPALHRGPPRRRDKKLLLALLHPDAPLGDAEAGKFPPAANDLARRRAPFYLSIQAEIVCSVCHKYVPPRYNVQGAFIRTRMPVGDN